MSLGTLGGSTPEDRLGYGGLPDGQFGATASTPQAQLNLNLPNLGQRMGPVTKQPGPVAPQLSGVRSSTGQFAGGQMAVRPVDPLASMLPNASLVQQQQAMAQRKQQRLSKYGI